jgi:simple sugar transport system permease protein
MEFCGIILNYALLYGALLLLGAISGYLSERAGIVNIGIDGMMCFGVVFFGIFSSPLIGITNMGPSGIIFALLFTMIATMITGAMHAFVCINLKANHVISGTAINLIGVAFCTFVNSKFGNIFYDGSSKLLSGFDDFLYVGNSLYGSSILIFIAALVLVVII